MEDISPTPSKHAIKVCLRLLVLFVQLSLTGATSSVIRLEPNDHDALQTKLFLLLQKEQYDAALALINNLENATKYSFEKAYSLYRLHRESEAEAMLADIKARERAVDESRGVTHLEAQLVRLT
jgi:hypothetical protein